MNFLSLVMFSSVLGLRVEHEKESRIQWYFVDDLSQYANGDIRQLKPVPFSADRPTFTELMETNGEAFVFDFDSEGGQVSGAYWLASQSQGKL